MKSKVDAARAYWTRHGAWLKQIIGPLILFEAAVAVVVMLVLNPLIFALLQAILALSADPFTGNTALVGFFLSPIGLLTVATAVIAVILLLAIEYGGASLIVRDGIEGRRLRPARIALHLVRRLPVLIGIAAIVFLAALVLVLPIAAVAFAAKSLILSDADIYFYVTVWPPNFVVAVVLVGLTALMAAGAGFWLLLRWGLAFPIALLHRVSPLKALSLSAVAVRGRKRALAIRLAAWLAGWAVLAFVVGAILAGLNGWFLSPQASLAALSRAGILLALVNGVALSLVASIARAALAVIATHFYLSESGPIAPVIGDGSVRGSRGNLLRWGAIAAVCVALPAVSAIQVASIVGSLDVEKPVYVTAHRAGSARAPENTLAALEQAIIAKADYAEIDVQETADGEVVVLHDTDLRRVAGVPRSIWQMRYDEIRDLDVGSWFDPSFASERIPTFRAFAAAAKGRIKLNVEIKINGHDEDLVARTLAILRETGMEHDAVISSLDLGALRQVRQADPQIPVGFIVATGLGRLSALDVDFYAISQRFATPGRIRTLNAIGRPVHVWQPDTAEAMVAAMLDGADNLITDDARLARETIVAFRQLSAPEQAFLRLRTAFLRADAMLDPSRWASAADY